MVHPTPIYETLASLLIFWVLWRRRRRIRAAAALRRLPSPRWAGRFLVEFVRINEPVAADGLTQPQLFAAASILLGTVLLLAGPPARRRTAALVACHSLTRTATAPAAFTASAAAVHSFFNPASDAWTMQRRQKTLLREAGAR